jgi:SPP1 gp7 family putative phage head morphogenesis protein
MPFKVLDSPEDADPKDRSANLAAVDTMAVRPSIALPFGWKLNIVQPGKSYDLLPYMDHHDTQMARAVLAQGMLLGGTTGSKGGSFALSESHADMFKLGELALMSNIEEHITAYLISKLHDFNFDKPLYSTFKFDEITDEVQNLMTAAFKGLVEKGNVPDWIADGISEKVADQMEIVRPTDADDSKKSALGSSAASSNTPAVTQSRKKKDTRLAKSEWWRELTAAEAKVQFSTIDKKADDAEQSMVDSLKPVFDKVSADATKRLKPLLEDKGAKALDGFTLNYSDDLKKVFANHMIDAYSTAKTTAADEINKSAPANKQTSKDLISQHAQAVTEKQFGDLLFNLKAIVTDAVRKNKLDSTELSIGDVIANIASMFSSFFDDKEDLTASALITTAINIGRDDVFQTFSNQIYAYQYSAILDDAVCPICADLDSSVVTEAEYYSTKWMPPIHFNCRCIWVAIMNDEEDKPEITGLPDAPGGATEPSLSIKHGDENSLSAAVDYQLYLNKQARALWLQKRR